MKKWSAHSDNETLILIAARAFCNEILLLKKHCIVKVIS